MGGHGINLFEIVAQNVARPSIIGWRYGMIRTAIERPRSLSQTHPRFRNASAGSFWPTARTDDQLPRKITISVCIICTVEGREAGLCFLLTIFDKNYKNSFGVIMDDVCAGFYVVVSLICFMVLNSYLM